MVRLSKRSEYGLIAIRHIAAKHDTELVTAKEISTIYGISFDLLAKVMQKLAKAGLLASTQGMHGGYTLSRSPADIPVSTIIHAIDGTSPAITQCIAEGADSCTVSSVCTIKSPLSKVQANIEQAFNRLSLLEIV